MIPIPDTVQIRRTIHDNTKTSYNQRIAMYQENQGNIPWLQAVAQSAGEMIVTGCERLGNRVAPSDVQKVKQQMLEFLEREYGL